MRFRLAKPPQVHQAALPFLDRATRREFWFKRAIIGSTLLVCGLLVWGTGAGRYAVRSLVEQARLATTRQFGLEPSRDEVDGLVRVRRARTVERTHQSVNDYYRGAGPAMQRLFQVTGMDPEHCVIGSGRAADAFLLSPLVFSPPTDTRPYRLLPNRRSIWLRQITLIGGPFGLFLVPDEPEVREAAAKIGAIVDEGSAQTTNSWGLRGPEPDPQAPARGIVLGDSFMQGMFNGDHDTPPLALQRNLSDLWRTRVSILNTGHIGYAPEQYYAALRDFGDRFRPHFVVVSVCPNDFGSGQAVMDGQGDDWAEATYWIDEIVAWCRRHTIPCILVPVPCDIQIIGVRKDGRYPAPISNLFPASGLHYCDPLDQFIDEHLQLKREGELRNKPYYQSALYNLEINDNHFSPLGAEVWAKIVARRLSLLMPSPAPASSRTVSSAAGT